ncbi:MAG TPA: Crp/Fnr family transcriptional regulator [Noviherbaspirillum sp.]|uniref:Crp/Fnr family transcriptional regulator n=1 Tax=Noviherbaspirillum sp. TaxID=1926288 RepID=UPI002B488191|nr:Crp/Fnr family transcriptional regulator [Noviherbaspirillum sp.]HJV85998.1 Crp/Fnr family transcriptional regulator [Noviherbaspirillum sp.]
MRTELPSQHGEQPLMKNILANVSPYRALDTGSLDQLVECSLPLRLHGQKEVIRQGEPAKGVYVVIYGQVKLYVGNRQGPHKVLAILGHDSCFGLAETFLDKPLGASVETTCDAMIVFTPKEKVMELARKNAAFFEQLMTCAARQTHSLILDVQRQSSSSAPQRLAGFLLRQCEHQSSRDIELSVSKTVIASHLDITSETFSRLLKRFTAQGMIEVHGRHIKVLDSAKMQTLQPS